MVKYVKKSVIIDAVKYQAGMEDGFDPVSKKPFISTLEGNMIFDEDAYIVTGIKGERYAVRKDIFEETYEKASVVEEKVRGYYSSVLSREVSVQTPGGYVREGELIGIRKMLNLLGIKVEGINTSE